MLWLPSNVLVIVKLVGAIGTKKEKKLHVMCSRSAKTESHYVTYLQKLVELHSIQVLDLQCYTLSESLLAQHSPRVLSQAVTQCSHLVSWLMWLTHSSSGN